MDKTQKFDKFIEDFDKTLATDTSTVKTIGMHRPPSPLASPTSPLLSTPTKACRNSISPDEAPLKPLGMTPVTANTGVRPVRLGSGMTRSTTMGSMSTSGGGLSRQPSRRGLNLGLNLSTKTQQQQQQQQKKASRLSSPESWSTAPAIAETFVTPSRQTHPTPALVTGTKDRARRRTDSSASEYDELNGSLRTLAAKEMRVTELRDKLKMIQQELDIEEAELEKLRGTIGSTIYREMSPNPSNGKVVPHMAAKDVQTKKESIWSKPVSFLNQFDQILQNEIEKLNKDAYTTSTKHSTASTSDDMLNSVSNSLWNFVSDVKHGLLGEEEGTSTTSTVTEEVETPKDNDGNEQEMITIRE